MGGEKEGGRNEGEEEKEQKNKSPLLPTNMNSDFWGLSE